AVPGFSRAVASQAVVVDPDQNFVVHLFTFDRQQPRLAGWRDAVTDRILNQRLQHQMRNQTIRDRRIYIDPDLEAITQPELLDLQVLLGEMQFFTEGDLMRGLRLQRGAQKVGQPRDHRGGRFALALQNQRRDSVERIEQKVWMDLVPQRS